jgi:hypothetical protein
VDRTATAWEPRFAREAKVQLEEDHARLVEILNREPAGAGWEGVRHGWGEYFGEEGLNRWRKGFTPVLRGLMTDTHGVWEPFFASAKMAQKVDLATIFAHQAFVDYLITFAQPIMETTNLDCVALLATAAEQGWHIPEMESALGVLFEHYLERGGLTDEDRVWFEERLPAYRLENIARTESMKAANWSSLQTFGNFGATHKEWLATLDNRVRPDHADAMARYSVGGNPGPILLSQPFEVGGVPMMYPGDGPPYQICNCRCTIAPFSPRWLEL